MVFFIAMACSALVPRCAPQLPASSRSRFTLKLCTPFDDSATAFDGLSCGAFKMQAYEGNAQRRRIADFLAARNGDPADDAAPTFASLRRQAHILREAWGLSVLQLEEYRFDSQYLKGGGTGAETRSWANWLVPGRLMLGQYPHCQPAVPGPSADDAREHLGRLLEAQVDGFACLQAEVPPQNEPSRWPEGGVYLPNSGDRSSWPAPFVRYASDAVAAAETAGRGQQPRFYHFGIADLSVPNITAHTPNQIS